MNTDNIVMWVILPSNADWDCFKTLISREILKIQNPLRGGTLCIFGSHAFVPISWMCKKQTSISHSSTEPEIISLDAELRLDGLPALELWDLIVSVLGNISRVSDRSGKPESDNHKHHKSHNKIDVTRDIDTMLGTAKLRHRKQHFSAHNARKRCIKKKCAGIHDRFQRDPVHRDSQLKIGWTEETCIAMDKMAQEDHSYCASHEEYERS